MQAEGKTESTTPMKLNPPVGIAAKERKERRDKACSHQTAHLKLHPPAEFFRHGPPH
jgi:hypothetical protein